MLKAFHTEGLLEAGCDEAGRGCLAGPVFAAAVILDPTKDISGLDDSKKLSRKARERLRSEIEENAMAYAVSTASPEEIDEINILNASYLAMHRSLDKLSMRPEQVLVDGNRFRPYRDIKHHCIIKGDGIYRAIAAASILAKTYRDEYMEGIHLEFPVYKWKKNMGYPTVEHRKAIKEHGICKYHRKTFRLTDDQLKLEF